MKLKSIKVQYTPGSNILIMITLRIFLFFFFPFFTTHNRVPCLYIVFDNVVDQ